jgi:protein-tyrosine phosphatase
MIDVHSHVLPGLDDGARDWETALKMCRQAEKDGIKGLVATPHFFRGLFPTPNVATVSSAVVDLQKLCEKSLIPELRIYLGADCHLHAEVVENVKADIVPTINGSRYLLLELPNEHLPPGTKQLLFDINIAGITPIITHPERNSVLSRHPSMLYEFVRGGAYAQVTAGSLTGLFGSETQRAAELMVAHHLVQLIASDAHDPERRPAILSAGVAAAAQIIGRDFAEQMAQDVPRAVLQDDPIRFAEPVRPERQKKKAFWQRLTGR